MNRRYTGIEISSEYVKEAKKRIKQSSIQIEGEGKRDWTPHLLDELKWLYHENKITTEQLANDSDLLTLFTLKYNNRINRETDKYQPEEIVKRLTNLRKSGRLGPLGVRMRPINNNVK